MAMGSEDGSLSDEAEDKGSPIGEEFDEDGNVTKVANLVFKDGMLGQGAFGLVRLARRRTAHKRKTRLTKNLDLESPSTGRGRGSTPRSAPRPRRPRRHQMNKSVSAPADQSFFTADVPTDDGSTPNAHAARRRNARSERSKRFLQGKRGSFESGMEPDEELVAVKIFSKSILKRRRTMQRDKKSRRVKVTTALDQVETEIALMKKLSHPNLVNLYDVIDSPESDMLYMALEYMTGGEILTYQDDGTFRRKEPRPNHRTQGVVDGHFTEEQAALYFVDILHGLAYLHQHHICHRDLKPENILLGAGGYAKVGDFGVSKIFDKDSNNCDVRRQPSLDESFVSSGEDSSSELKQLEAPPSPVHSKNMLDRRDTEGALAMEGMARFGMLSKTEGTWCFWSPEMCEGSQAFSGYAADLWAAGVCLYIFVTGRLPFYSETPNDLFDLIAKAEIDYESLGLSESLTDLLKKCLAKDPAIRAGVGDCLQHPFLQTARDTRIKQLSVEFEIARKRKIEVSEADVKSAFRRVTMVPKKLIRRASRTISSASKMLHESFSGKLSIGVPTPSGSTTADDHLEESRSIHAHKGGGHTSSTNSNDSLNGRIAHFFHRGQSSASSASGRDERAADAAPAIKEVSFNENRVRRMASALSSDSLCSLGTDDFPAVVHEGDEEEEAGEDSPKKDVECEKNEALDGDVPTMDADEPSKDVTKEESTKPESEPSENGAQEPVAQAADATPEPSTKTADIEPRKLNGQLAATEPPPEPKKAPTLPERAPAKQSRASNKRQKRRSHDDHDPKCVIQ